jgi:hypothetical protein
VYERISNENILCTRDRYDAGFLSDARSCQYHLSNPAVVSRVR